MEAANHLAKNIRFLRKQRKLSQQKLATILAVKRSNIAAYETKNVEPRLYLINKIANYFEIDLADLICRDLEEVSINGADQEVGAAPDGTFRYSRIPPIGNQLRAEAYSIEQFREQSVNVRKMLEGFKVFYQYKQDLRRAPESAQVRYGPSDVENFLIFIDHMLQYNERIIRLFDESLSSQHLSTGNSTNNSGRVS